MSDPSSSAAVPAPDCLDGAPHPRLQKPIIGHGKTIDALAESLASKRFHHAWILGGPKGIGKSTLSYSIARHLLAAPADRGTGLDVDSDSQAVRLIGTGSHPNLFVLKRPFDPKRKKLLTIISVDEVRRLKRFFEATAANGGWRVTIIDSADDLNRQAANALLKLIEEPPEKSLFLIVSHRPGRLLPTLRSRCRMVRLGPLSDSDVGEGLARLAPEADAGARSDAIAMAAGSLGQALRLLTGGNELRDLNAALRALPSSDPAKTHALADHLAKAGGEGLFQLAIGLIQDWLATEMRYRVPAASSSALARFAEVWEKIDALARDTESLNLDRKQAFLLAFALLEDLAGQAGKSGAPQP